MKQSLAGLGLVLLAAGAPVQSPTAKLDPRMARGFEAIREQDLRGDLTFLASDPLQGRMSLQPGSEVAIEWIAGEFHKAGLAPAASGSYFQTVPLVEYRPDLEAMRLTLTRGGRPQTFAYLKDFYGGFAREVTLSAPLVFAGYGITAPEFGYDDYANVDAGGKIVLLFDHEPQEDDARSPFNGLGNTRHANSRLKILNAQRHGALAVLVAPEPNRKHPSNIDRLKRIPGFTERIRRFPSQAIADDEVRIPLLSLDDLSVKTLLATQPRSPSELQTAIDASLKPGSLALPDTTVEIRIANAETRRAASRNVIGILEGSDPAQRLGYRRRGRVGPRVRGESGEAAAHAPLRGLRRGGARASGLVLLQPAPVAAPGDDSGRDQLRHDRTQREPERADRGLDRDRRRYLERAEPHRHHQQPAVPGGHGACQRVRRPGPELQVG